MTLETDFNQKATVWPKTTTNAHGVPSFGTPFEVSCHWEGGSREIILPGGDRVTAQSLIMVDMELDVGDLIRLGPKPTSGSVTKLEEIVFSEVIPDVKAMNFQYNISTIRYPGTLEI